MLRLLHSFVLFFFRRVLVFLSWEYLFCYPELVQETYQCSLVQKTVTICNPFICRKVQSCRNVLARNEPSPKAAASAAKTHSLRTKAWLPRSCVGVWCLLVRKWPCYIDAFLSQQPTWQGATAAEYLSNIPFLSLPKWGPARLGRRPLAQPIQKIPSQIMLKAVWHQYPSLAFVHDWVQCVSENLCLHPNFSLCFVKLPPTYSVFNQNIS